MARLFVIAIIDLWLESKGTSINDVRFFRVFEPPSFLCWSVQILPKIPFYWSSHSKNPNPLLKIGNHLWMTPKD